MDNIAGALLFAKMALLLIALAASYFILINVAKTLRRKPWSGQLAPIIQKLIPVSRRIHVYSGAGASIAVTLHAYLILSTYPLTGTKIYLGLIAASMLVIAASLGLVLMRNRSDRRIRHWHRNTVMVFIIVVLLHRFVN